RASMLNVRIGNNQRRQPLNDGRVFDDRGHSDMGSLNEINSGYLDDAFEEFLQSRHISFEVWQLFVEKHVFGSQQHTVRAFAGIQPYAFENVFQGKRAPHLGCRSAELTATSATSRDLNHSKGGAVTNNRNLINSRLHILGDF